MNATKHTQFQGPFLDFVCLKIFQSLGKTYFFEKQRAGLHRDNVQYYTDPALCHERQNLMGEIHVRFSINSSYDWLPVILI